MAATKDHDRNLLALLQCCRIKGIKLNKEKLQLHRTNISFMGHELTPEGIKPSQTKVEAIEQFPVPTDKAAVQRLLGMAGYLARYCPNFSDITLVLRQLTKQENEFRWDVRHQAAFEQLKRMLQTAPVLGYFDPNKSLRIQCDSSQSGLGAVLMQGSTVIEFASRALSDTEQRYSQLEKELLSIVFAMTKWHTYTYG